MDAFNLIFGLIMIGAFIGLIIVAKKQKTQHNAQMAAVIFAGVVLVCGVAISVHNLFYDKNAKYEGIENGYAESTAYIMGEELAKRFPGAKLLVIVEPDYQNNKTMLGMVNALKKGLGSKMTKVDVEPLKVKIPPTYTLLSVMKAKDFNSIIKAKKPSIVLTLVGLPNDFQKLDIWKMYEDEPEKAPKLAVINGSISDLYPVIKEGVVVAAVRYKPDVFVDENDVCPADYKKAFDKRYLMITPKNVDQIKKKYGSKIFRK